MNRTARQISMINPYYAKVMKKREESVENLRIVENFFIPMADDLDRITELIRDCKTVVDIGSGYGLLINELAKRNPEKIFLGIDTMYWDKKFQLPIAEKNVSFEFNGIEAMTSDRNPSKQEFDCVICCWMPDQSDWREMMSLIARKAVVLILSKYFASGTMEVYTEGMAPFGFKLKKVWISWNSKIEVWGKNAAK